MLKSMFAVVFLLVGFSNFLPLIKIIYNSLDYFVLQYLELHI